MSTPNNDSLSSNEEVLLVDLNNNVVGSCPRKEMRAKNLPHRASYILVFHAGDKIIVQKRTKYKDYCPGYYEVTAGGVNSFGESKEECARRELFEELGISNSLEYCFPFFYQDSHTTVWGDFWTCRFEGRVPEDLTLQESEVESVQLMTVEQILQEADSKQKQFTPDSLYALRKWVSRNKD
jgi:8-oxo-dGTP pyrophosphatase MutT (NUDIX family)